MLVFLMLNGYGLSYTEFKVENLKIGEKEVPTDGKIEVSCSVSNTGKAAGDEVVQLYQSSMEHMW